MEKIFKAFCDKNFNFMGISLFLITTFDITKF